MQTFTQKIRQLLITKKDVCNILWNIELHNEQIHTSQ